MRDPVSNIEKDTVWWWCWRFYGHFRAHGRLNGPCDSQKHWCEVKDESLFRYANAEIRTQVVVTCDPTRYHLDHGGAIRRCIETIRYKSFRKSTSRPRNKLHDSIKLWKYLVRFCLFYLWIKYVVFCVLECVFILFQY